MKSMRSKLAILALTTLCLCGCKVDGMSREAEAVLGLPLAWMGVAPSWDVNRGVELEAPGPRRSSPCLEFVCGLPLFPLFLPSWEEERPREEGSNWWTYRQASFHS